MKIRRRKKARTSKVSTNRWPLYIPKEDLAWFNEMSDYAVNKVGVSMSHLIRRLLKAWELNEIESGKKRPVQGSDTKA